MFRHYSNSIQRNHTKLSTGKKTSSSSTCTSTTIPNSTTLATIHTNPLFTSKRIQLLFSPTSYITIAISSSSPPPPSSISILPKHLAFTTTTSFISSATATPAAVSTTNTANVTSLSSHEYTRQFQSTTTRLNLHSSSSSSSSLIPISSATFTTDTMMHYFTNLFMLIPILVLYEYDKSQCDNDANKDSSASTASAHSPNTPTKTQSTKPDVKYRRRLTIQDKLNSSSSNHSTNNEVTNNNVKRIPISIYNDEQHESCPMNIMYSLEYQDTSTSTTTTTTVDNPSLSFQRKSSISSPSSSITMQPPPPFPQNQVGSFTYHGMEARSYMIQNPKPSQRDNPNNSSSSSSLSSSSTTSFFRSNFWSTKTGNNNNNNNNNNSQKNPERHRPSFQLVTVMEGKINQDRGNVIYPYGYYNSTNNKNAIHNTRENNKNNNNNNENFEPIYFNKTALFGIFDGHGEKGELLAEYAMNALSYSLFRHPNYDNDWNSATAATAISTTTQTQSSKQASQQEYNNMTKAFRETFLEIDQTIRNTTELYPMTSGSTACVVLVKDKTLWVANIGDSRAVLAKRRKMNYDDCAIDCVNEDKATTSNEKKKRVKYTTQRQQQQQQQQERQKIMMDAINLTKDQNAFDESERKRIVQSGGYVTLPTQKGLPARVWSDESCSNIGLAMTRSLGDYTLKHVGVIADPVVSQYDIKDEDEFIILASDGLWEFVTSHEAVRIVQECFENGDGASEACRKLISIAASRWNEFEGDYRDDITVTVVRLPGLWD